MFDLQILMPMGGVGDRFRRAGITTPKPLIDVLGVPMFMRALSSFDPLDATLKITVVIREDHEKEFGLASRIRAAESAASIVMLDHDTRGAVETCMAAQSHLDLELPLVILDCDTSFHSPQYFASIKQAVSTRHVDGILLSFKSTDPGYSYAEVGESGIVIRTAEKQPISSHALTGAYFFTETAVFLDAARVLMDKQISAQMPEYYVSLVFNELIASGKRISLVQGDVFSFGTPEELAQFQKLTR